MVASEGNILAAVTLRLMQTIQRVHTCADAGHVVVKLPDNISWGGRDCPDLLTCWPRGVRTAGEGRAYGARL